MSTDWCSSRKQASQYVITSWVAQPGFSSWCSEIDVPLTRIFDDLMRNVASFTKGAETCSLYRFRNWNACYSVRAIPRESVRRLPSGSVLHMPVVKPQKTFLFIHVVSIVVWWSELLTTNHEVPGSIPGSVMGIFPCRGRIPVVTMVWVVSRIRLKVETSVTRSHNSINSDWIHVRDLLAGGDLTTRDSQHISS